MGAARRDAQGDELLRCAVLEQCGLRQKREPATFSGSHRCTSDVRPWSGARPCYRTGASRLITGSSLISPSSSEASSDNASPCTPSLWRGHPLSSIEAVHRRYPRQSVPGLPLRRSTCARSPDVLLIASLPQISSISSWKYATVCRTCQAQNRARQDNPR